MSPKSNPTVLFIHGLWMHPTTWDPWAQVFSAQGYSTMARDGQGTRRPWVRRVNTRKTSRDTASRT